MVLVLKFNDRDVSTPTSQSSTCFHLNFNNSVISPGVQYAIQFGLHNDPDSLWDLEDRNVSTLTRRSSTSSRADSIRSPSSTLINDHELYIDAEHETIRSGETPSNLMLPAMHKLECRTGRSITWIDDVRRRADIPCLAWEPSWFEATAKIPDRHPDYKKSSPCTVENCILPNGHWSSHELWKPCNMNGCSLRQDHTGDHIIIHGKMGSEDLREVDARLARDAKARKRYWQELADAVLEAMRRPQLEYQWASKMEETVMKPFKTTKMKASIPSPSLPIEEPSSLYQRYVLEDRHIRLFQLNPGTTTSGITGSFICTELSTCSAYIALSYTWGDYGTERKIMISDQGELTIGDNLWSFLHLQSLVVTQPTSFWIDAVCIDQSNVHERNHQVGLMKQIYASAAEVYVWLGQKANNSDVAMHFLATHASKPLRRRGQGYYPVWSKQQGNALYALCERPYWRRMWIIQELLHAKDITVWCGSFHFSWENLETLYLKLKTVEESNWFAHHKYHMMVMQSSAAVMVWQRAHWRHPNTPVPRLQTLIEIFRDWQCTEIRDKVFALSGMATQESTVVPDYALTTREVYFAVLQNIRGQQEQFRILLSQILGLAGRDVDLNGQDMIEYRTPDAQRLVLKARQNDWTDSAV